MKNSTKDSLINYCLAVASGLLLSAAFPRPSIVLFAWIGFVPLFFALKRASLRQAAVLGLLVGLAFFGVLLSWIQIFGVLAWIALTLLLSIWIALFSVGSKLVMRRLGAAAQVAVIPALWALGEYGRGSGPLAFAWGNLGSTTVGLKLSWIGSYVGEVGLSFVIVLFNLLLFKAIEQLAERAQEMEERTRTERVKAASVYGVIALAALVIALAAPSFAPDGASVSRTTKVAIVQPNIPQSVKLDLANNDEIKARYLTMTRAVVGRNSVGNSINLVVWPESVFISYINDEGEYLDRVRQLLKGANAGLIFGGLEHNQTTGKLYNSAFYYDYNGDDHGTYRKIHLVPFGEYMPMRGFIERVNDMAKLVQDKTPGSGYKVYDFKRLQFAKGYPNIVHDLGKFSTIICFESADSRLVGEMVRRGAHMIVVITNDGWFGNTAALEQHFMLARMRAIEYGVPVIQAANTGVSGVITSDGRVVKRTHINSQQTLVSDVSFSQDLSFFARFGSKLPYLYLIIVVAALAAAQFGAVKARRAKVS